LRQRICTAAIWVEPFKRGVQRANQHQTHLVVVSQTFRAFSLSNDVAAVCL
jgi:hypothetical protein